MAVRWASVSDAEVLADVHVRSWQAAYADVFTEDFLTRLDPGARVRWWRSFIAEGARVHVVGDGEVFGFCHADSSEDEGWGEVFSIYLAPERWGEGHGRELLAAGEATLVEAGHDRALLWVLEENMRARRFYERQGWCLGKPFRIEVIGGTQVTEVRYEKDLTSAPAPRRDHRDRSP